MNGIRRRKAWLACLALLFLASCGDKAAEGNGTDASDGDGETAWSGPEITQEKLDSFPDARAAFRAGESLESFGLTKGEFLELDRAIKKCREVLQWEADEGGSYITDLEGELQKLESRLGGTGLDATARQGIQGEIDKKKDELEQEKAREAGLPVGIPVEYIDLVRNNLDRIRE